MNIAADPKTLKPAIDPVTLEVIRHGLVSTVICGYGRDAWSRTHKSEEARVRNGTRPASQLPREFGPEYGYFSAAAAHAFGATRHMHLYGTTKEHFGQIGRAHV